MDQQARSDFVERFARVFSESGQASRNTGRIYAWLATSQEPHASLQEIADGLGISRGSVSMGTRQLIAMEMIRKVPVAGARGDYYAASIAGTDVLLQRLIEMAQTYAKILELGIALHGDRLSPGLQGLTSLRQTYLEISSAFDTRLATRKSAQ